MTTARVRVLPGALLVLAGALAWGAEKGGPFVLKVEDDGGAVFSGRARLKKDQLEVETLSGLKKLPYSRVRSIEEIDPLAPPPDSEREADRAEHEKRSKALDAKPDADPKKGAKAWSALGAWARKRALDAEATADFERAIALDADEPDARLAKGEAKDDAGAWKPIPEVLAARKAKAGQDPAALLEVARWAAKQGEDEEAIALAGALALKNAFDSQLLAFLRPVTDRWRQRTAPLAPPFRGRWRADPDITHHHEKKSYAVYAIDFWRDVEGSHKKEGGKTLEDYYSFGEPIHAAQDGDVAAVEEGYPDNPPMTMTNQGNSILLHHQGCEFTFYGHTKKGSITLKVGDKVKKGDVIARVGNSGHANIPHLHFTLIDAYHQVSLPCRYADFSLLAEDGTPVAVKRGRILEGMLVEGRDPRSPPAPSPTPGASTPPK